MGKEKQKTIKNLPIWQQGLEGLLNLKQDLEVEKKEKNQNKQDSTLSHNIKMLDILIKNNTYHLRITHKELEKLSHKTKITSKNLLLNYGIVHSSISESYSTFMITDISLFKDLLKEDVAIYPE